MAKINDVAMQLLIDENKDLKSKLGAEKVINKVLFFAVVLLSLKIAMLIGL